MEPVTRRTALDRIPLPEIAKQQTYRLKVMGEEFSFKGLAALLGAADLSKAGDRESGLAASNEVEREAARTLLSELTLEHIYHHPLLTAEGDIDEIMVVNYDLDEQVFEELAPMTVGALKDRIQMIDGDELLRIGRGLTGVMVAAVTKLMSVHDLIFNARKIRCPIQTRNHLGLPGTLSSRIQPNHPTDDLAAISAMVLQSLSMGNGDLMIGLNPSTDTVDNIGACLTHLHNLRKHTGAPTQVCVLSHIRTQLACLEEGVPVDILFQSLAGSDKALRQAFDVSVEFMDAAWDVMKEKGALSGQTDNFMYFETGQGSEVSYGFHDNIDMTTMEALTYGLCRRYEPGMVNSVTGFIGPETHANSREIMYSNLQDLFMGKLMGLPMGVSPCFTMHADADVEDQEMAIQLLTSAGAHYFMDIYLGVDRMLAYADTSGHDNQTMREIHNLRPAPEFWHWCLDQKIFTEDKQGRIQRGPNWGRPEIFCESRPEFDKMMSRVPMNYGTASSGPRMSNEVQRELRMNMAVSRRAAVSELDFSRFQHLDYRVVATQADTFQKHHASTQLGCKLSPASRALLKTENNDIQIVLTDGLSAEAVHANIDTVLPVLEDGLTAAGFSMGQTIIARHGRVKLAEDIARVLNSRLVIILLGERPGASAESSRSLSAYLVHRLEDDESLKLARMFAGIPGLEFENSVIPNIYREGTPPAEAGSLIVEKAIQILDNKAAGNRLNSILGSLMGLPARLDLGFSLEKKDKSEKKAGAARLYDFGGQKTITEADIMILAQWGVREALVSRRAILSPLAMDLVGCERIKIRYNDIHAV